MKRKLLSLVLASTLCLSLLPTAAFASNEVAVTGCNNTTKNSTYASLQAALDAVEGTTGATVTLPSGSGSDDFVIDSDLTLKTGSYTLNLNGRHLRLRDIYGSTYTLTAASGATVTITSSNAQQRITCNTLKVEDGASLTLGIMVEDWSSKTINQYTIAAGGSLTVNGTYGHLRGEIASAGTLNLQGSDTYPFIYSTLTVTGGTVNIHAGQFTSNSSVTVNGGTVNLKGGSLQSGSTLTVNTGGSVNATGGSVQGTTMVSGGTLNAKGTSFSGTFTYSYGTVSVEDSSKLTGTITAPFGITGKNDTGAQGKIYGNTVALSVSASSNSNWTSSEPPVPEYKWSIYPQGQTPPAAPAATTAAYSSGDLNAGTYEASCTVSYGSYSVIVPFTPFTVGKAPSTASPEPSGAVGLTYTGSNQSLLNPVGNTTDGYLLYRIGESGPFDTSPPRASDAGDYPIYWKIPGNSNHTNYPPASEAAGPIIVTIAKNTNYYSTNCTAAPTMDDYAYGAATVPDPASLNSYSAQEGAAVSYQWRSADSTSDADWTNWTGSSTALNVGSYQLRVQIAQSRNYEAYTGTNYGAFQVTRGSLSGLTVSGMTDYTYGDETLPSPTVTGVPAGASVNLYYNTTDSSVGGEEWRDMTGTSLDAGTYYLYAVIGESANYGSFTTPTVAFTVNKADLTYTAPAAVTGLTYNGSEQALVTAGTAGIGSMEYRLGSGPWSTDLPAAENAADYTVYWRMEGDSNHNPASGGPISVSIGKKTATITARDKTLSVGDPAPTPTTTAPAEEYEVTGTVGSDTLPHPSLTYVPSPDMTQPGTSSIQVSGVSEAGNYSISYVPGTLTIQALSGGGGGGGSVSYLITVTESGSGTATANARYAVRGQTVTITAAPAAGHLLNSLTAVDKNGTALPLTDQGSGRYSFVMPASKVEVRAVFAAERSSGFSDVTEGDYYFDAVNWAASSGITIGTDSTHFTPDMVCSRAQFVTFLWRMAGSPKVEHTLSFPDVEENAWYTEAVCWAASVVVVKGYDTGLFGSDDDITREQAATILHRFALLLGLDVSVGEQTNLLSYTDALDISDYAFEALQWACGAGIVQGYNGKLMPGEPCTRAQLVTMLFRVAQLSGQTTLS